MCLTEDGERRLNETDPNFDCTNDNPCPGMTRYCISTIETIVKLFKIILPKAAWSTWVVGTLCDGGCGGGLGVKSRYRKCDNPAPGKNQEHCELSDGTKGLVEKDLNVPCMNNAPCDGKYQYICIHNKNIVYTGNFGSHMHIKNLVTGLAGVSGCATCVAQLIQG